MVARQVYSVTFGLDSTPLPSRSRARAGKQQLSEQHPRQLKSEQQDPSFFSFPSKMSSSDNWVLSICRTASQNQRI